jgi:hypothetical protein
MAESSFRAVWDVWVEEEANLLLCHWPELLARNRVAWNRYFAANLNEYTRKRLIEEKRHPAEELTGFSPEELQEIATAFAGRSKTAPEKLALPESGAKSTFRMSNF